MIKNTKGTQKQNKIQRTKDKDGTFTQDKHEFRTKNSCHVLIDLGKLKNTGR